MFRLKVIFRPLQHFSYHMLCPLWDPIVLPKSPHSDHNTVDKNSIEQSIERCQHQGEGTHIHVVEQDRQQGMKKTTKYVTTTKTAGKLYTTIQCNNPESDTG